MISDNYDVTDITNRTTTTYTARPFTERVLSKKEIAKSENIRSKLFWYNPRKINIKQKPFINRIKIVIRNQLL